MVKLLLILKKLIALFLMIIILPLIIIFYLLIYFEDKANPIYQGERVGKDFKKFKLYKLRSMIIRKNKGFQSTSLNDSRILKIGRLIRKTKIDELLQIINVIKGDINFVGPRPNVVEEVDQYIEKERALLSYKPGTTDFSSIIFSDEGEILKNSVNPDLDYKLLIRPRKNILALLYLQDRNIFSDIYIVFLTILNIVNRNLTVRLIYNYMKKKYKNYDFEFILRNKKLSRIENLDNFFKLYEN